MKTSIIAAALTAGLALGACDKNQDAADNTGRNRDHEQQKTAGDQSNSSGDVDRTAAIRRAVVDEDSLSTDAKNVKIVTVGGKVTLTGPVASSTEKALVLRKAVEVAGTGNVVDELSITGDEAPTPSALPQRP